MYLCVNRYVDRGYRPRNFRKARNGVTGPAATGERIPRVPFEIEV